MARYSLDSIVGKCLHRPITSGDPDRLPLYKRNDGVFDETSNVKQTRSDAWMNAVNTNYSSPNNVRRLFITYKGVYVHYFRPMVGDKSRETEKFYSYKDLYKDSNRGFEPEKILLRQDMQSEVTKFGLGALRGQWTCSNIEEIYFDWTVLLSSDLGRLGLGSAINSMVLMNGKTGQGGVKQGDILWNIFSNACLTSGENVQKTFPRLRTICYIDKLDQIYAGIKRKPGEESAEDLARTWIQPYLGQLGRMNNLYIMLYKVPNVSSLNAKYITRNFYCFDDEVLTPYFETLKSKITKYIAEKRKGTTSEVAKDSPFRDMILKTEKEKGLQAAKKLLNTMLNLPSADKEEMLALFTDEERKRLGGD